MKVLVAYFTQTGNTEKIARAIYEEALAQGHQAQLQRIQEITAAELNRYELVFLGSACHSADLAGPVIKILKRIARRPLFKLAGFVTHATYTPEEGERQRELYEEWAGRCLESFERVSQEKEIEWCGYFNCQGVPSAPIEAFIHREIVTDEKEWEEYIAKVREHPNEQDVQKARDFARAVLVRAEQKRP